MKSIETRITEALARTGTMLKQYKITQGTESTKGREHLQPRTVLSPYRINPLGAHVDHQGGNVLAQPIDQYTILSFATISPPANTSETLSITVYSQHPDWSDQPCKLTVKNGQVQLQSAGPESGEPANWQRYLIAAVSAFIVQFPLEKDLLATVDGTLIGAGLSSSASVILAYLRALEECSPATLTQQQQVELCRIVENQHMGLNNGVQDQMSIVFGRKRGLAVLDVNQVSVTLAESPASVENVCWVLLYSGYSRELINSGFNTRVAECAEAAAILQPGCQRLGDVDCSNYSEQAVDKLPTHLAGRARHFRTETDRVQRGASAWSNGDWKTFGALMNASCASSIANYESGSDALVDAQRIAQDQAGNGVYGSRFGGGGYGGCLIMLVQRDAAEKLRDQVLHDYLQHYPDRRGIARAMIAAASDGLQILDSHTEGVL